MGNLADFTPAAGIVLGSGLGAFVDLLFIEETVAYHEIEDFPVSRVPGHEGRFVFGVLGDVPVVVAQGRVHLYEGRTAHEVTANVRFLADCGVPNIILTNAAGSLNPAFTPGSWMMLTDHLNLTGTTPFLPSQSFHDMSAVYSAPLAQRFREAARARHSTLHEGIYAGVPGPQFETPAEVRMLRTLGADAVGMSTVLEAMQAAALDLEVAGFSCLTNWAAGLAPGPPLDHHDVLAAGAQAAAELGGLLASALMAAPRP